MRNRKLLIVIAVVLSLMATSVPTFAASGLSDDPNITVVSPSKDAVMKTGKVLVSVKMTAPRTIKMSFYSVDNSSKKLITSETYSSSRNLSYYTRQLTGLNPGVYCINISTLNSSGDAIYATEMYIKVQKKTSSTVQVDVFNSSGTSSSFWSSLLKKLLG